MGRALRRLGWLAVLGSGWLVACGNDHPPLPANGAPAGNAENGRLLLRQFGCGDCHRIPGVAAARGRVGPPLDRMARRVYVAGMLPNTPQGLSDWIRDPQAHSPGTLMPDMQVSSGHARDMVAYLYTLR